MAHWILLRMVFAWGKTYGAICALAIKLFCERLFKKKHTQSNHLLRHLFQIFARGKAGVFFEIPVEGSLRVEPAIKS